MKLINMIPKAFFFQTKACHLCINQHLFPPNRQDAVPRFPFVDLMSSSLLFPSECP